MPRWRCGSLEGSKWLHSDCLAELDIFGSDEGPFLRENAGALDDVLQFTHVARPGMRCKYLHRFAAEPLDHSLSGRLAEKVCR